MLDSKVASILVVVLTFVAWLLVVITMAVDDSVAKFPVSGCGVFGCVYQCGIGFFRIMMQMFSIVAILSISAAGIVHILQIVNLLGKIVAEEYYKYIKFIHLTAMLTLASADLCMIIYYASLDCDHNDYNHSLSFGIFLYIVAMFVEGVCFFMCWSPGLGMQHGCQPLINTADH